MVKLNNKLFLVVGASGVGKTTLVRELTKGQLIYIGYDIDAEIAKKYGNKGEEVVAYFQRVGIREFQKNAFDIIFDIEKRHENDSEIVLIDVGAGATYSWGAANFPVLFNCILLTAKPRYLWDNREKARANHENFKHYNMWQFDLQKSFHDRCQIKIDIAYLDIIGVKATVHRKITGYNKG